MATPMGPEAWTEQQTTTTVTVDDHAVEMAAYEAGSGDPLVFLHGIPTWSYLWRGVAPAFENDRRVIAPDMVGYGNSAMDDSFDRSIRAQEAAVLDLLDQRGVDSFDLVAHDVGGGVAQRIAAHTDRVDQLVLSNAVCFDAWPIELITNLGLPATIDSMSVQEVQTTLKGLFEEGLVDADEAFVEAMASRYASDVGRISLARNAIATNTNHTTEIDYDAIDAETLLLWGELDQFMPIEYANRLEDRLENAVDVVGLEVPHWVPEDASEAFVEHLETFLE